MKGESARLTVEPLVALKSNYDAMVLWVNRTQLPDIAQNCLDLLVSGTSTATVDGS
jgi:hypothetical protein